MAPEVPQTEGKPPIAIPPPALDEDELQKTRTATTKGWMNVRVWPKSVKRRRALQTCARRPSALEGPVFQHRAFFISGIFQDDAAPSAISVGTETYTLSGVQLWGGSVLQSADGFILESTWAHAQR